MIDIPQIAMFLSVLLVSVSLHEMMHAYVAFRLGDDLAHSHGRISLNPFVHIDPYLTIVLPLVLLLLSQPPILAAKPVPINSSRIDGEEAGLAVVGIAGPLTNLALAFIFGALLQVTSYGGVPLQIIELFVGINVSLFVFNMLPLPPLDGSRLLYAVAPESVRSVMRQIESYGIFGLIIILMLAYPVIDPILSTGRQFVLGLVL
ncbi:MAG: Zn-dependent protease [Candidatus Saccharimonadales bacterium]|jgi:Zn-dependent protease